VADEIGTGRQELALPFIACSLMMLASLANFLVHNDYPLMRPEVLVLGSALLIGSLVAAPLVGSRWRWLRSLAQGLLVALFIELNTTLLPVALIGGVAVAAVTYFRRTSLAGPMALFGGIVLATTLLGLGGRTAWLSSKSGPPQPPASSRPAIVHIILDEHIGIEGLPKNDPDARRLAGELRSFYRNGGFSLYGGAYSEHMRTANAIPNVLQFGQGIGTGYRGDTVLVGRTKYFESLRAKGYRLNVIQSDFADFCSSTPVAECVTYESASPSALLTTPFTTLERTGLLATKFMALSEIAKATLLPWRLVSGWGRSAGLHLPRLDPANLARSSTPATMRVMDDLTKRLAQAEPGTVYFTHLLLPHYPYAYDADCGLLPWSEWKKPFAPRNIRVRQKAYYAQVRCTTRKLKAALDALDRSPAGRDAVVIIHGDHGSRITEVDPSEENVGKFSNSDLIAAYSTLFAIRTPQRTPSYSTEQQPITRLLQQFVALNFERPLSLAPVPHPTVHLDGPGGTPGKRVPLPSF
jgi:hypothetical protein